MLVSSLGRLQRLLAQPPLAADSGVLHVCLEGARQASLNNPLPDTSHHSFNMQSIMIRSTKQLPLFSMVCLGSPLEAMPTAAGMEDTAVVLCQTPWHPMAGEQRQGKSTPV